jgi:hypothetical protein
MTTITDNTDSTNAAHPFDDIDEMVAEIIGYMGGIDAAVTQQDEIVRRIENVLVAHLSAGVCDERGLSPDPLDDPDNWGEEVEDEDERERDAITHAVSNAYTACELRSLVQMSLERRVTAYFAHEPSKPMEAKHA